MVEEQRLGYASTVCPDATPNLSPKGTTAVWDDDHLIFADIRSPGTVENLLRNPTIEINVVDPISRKGYRFKGDLLRPADQRPRRVSLSEAQEIAIGRESDAEVDVGSGIDGAPALLLAVGAQEAYELNRRLGLW